VNCPSERRAVFLDRDGVLIEDVGYLSEPGAVALLPGAAEAVAALRDAGWRVVVITNQSGVARGMLTEARLAEIHARLRELLAVEGAEIDGLYYCPHHPDGDVEAYRRSCDCRKPAPGLLRAAARELEIGLSASWMVGDKASDIAAGAAAGCRTVLVGSAARAGDGSPAPDHRTASLPGAVRIILGAGPTRDR